MLTPNYFCSRTIPVARIDARPEHHRVYRHYDRRIAMKRASKLGLAVAAAAAVSMLAAGCSSSPSTGTKTSPVTLTFWGSYGNGGNSTQQDALNKTLIPEFEKANPGITVKYTDIAYDPLLQKLTTSAAGGQLPDLVRADIGWVPEFAQNGVLVPLSDAMSDFK